MTVLAHLRAAGLRGLVLTMVSAAPVCAAEYETAGKATAVIDGERFELWTPYDARTDTRHAQQLGSGVMSTVTIEAVSGAPGETIEAPRVVLSIFGPPSRATATRLRVALPDDPADIAWEAGVEGPGTIESAEIRRDGDQVSFSATATVRRVELMLGEVVSDGDPDAPEAAAKRVSIEGRVDLAP